MGVGRFPSEGSLVDCSKRWPKIISVGANNAEIAEILTPQLRGKHFSTEGLIVNFKIQDRCADNDKGSCSMTM